MCYGTRWHARIPLTARKSSTCPPLSRPRCNDLARWALMSNTPSRRWCVSAAAPVGGHDGCAHQHAYAAKRSLRRRACTLSTVIGLGSSSAMPACVHRARSSSLHDAVKACAPASSTQWLPAVPMPHRRPVPTHHDGRVWPCAARHQCADGARCTQAVHDWHCRQETRVSAASSQRQQWERTVQVHEHSVEAFCRCPFSASTMVQERWQAHLACTPPPRRRRRRRA